MSCFYVQRREKEINSGGKKEEMRNNEIQTEKKKIKREWGKRGMI